MTTKKELMDKARVLKKNCKCNKPISGYNKTQLEQYINEKEIKPTKSNILKKQVKEKKKKDKYYEGVAKKGKEAEQSRFKANQAKAKAKALAKKKAVVKRPKLPFNAEMLEDHIYEKDIGGETKKPYQHYDCKKIIVISKDMIKAKRLNYPKNLNLGDRYYDKGIRIKKGSGLSAVMKTYKITDLEALMDRMKWISKDSTNMRTIFNECGVQEKLFLTKARDIYKADYSKIKAIVLKTRSRFVKGQKLSF